eukprot:g1862.t1
MGLKCCRYSDEEDSGYSHRLVSRRRRINMNDDSIDDIVQLLSPKRRAELRRLQMGVHTAFKRHAKALKTLEKWELSPLKDTDSGRKEISKLMNDVELHGTSLRHKSALLLDSVEQALETQKSESEWRASKEAALVDEKDNNDKTKIIRPSNENTDAHTASRRSSIALRNHLATSETKEESGKNEDIGPRKKRPHRSSSSLSSECRRETKLKGKLDSIPLSVVDKEKEVPKLEAKVELEPHLVSLSKVEHFQMMTDESVIGIARLSHLIDLTLDSCGITENGMQILAKEVPMLLSLRLHRCNDVTDNGIQAFRIRSVSQKMQNLQKFSLVLCNKVSDVSLMAIAGMAGLIELEIGFLNLVTSTGLSAICGSEKLGASLHNLCLEQLDSADETGLSNISSLQNLQTLRLRSLNCVVDTVVKELSKLESLQILDLERLDNITDESMVSISNLPMLEQLWIEMCDRVTNFGIKTISEAVRTHDKDDEGRLHSLAFRSMSHLTSTGIEPLIGSKLLKLEMNGSLRNPIDSKALAKVSNITSLQHLSLANIFVNNEAMKLFATSLKNLTFFSLCNSFGPNYDTSSGDEEDRRMDLDFKWNDQELSCGFESLQLLANLPNLSELHFQHVSSLTSDTRGGLDDATLIALQNAPSLGTLYIESCPFVTNKGLQALQHYPHLHSLTLSHMNQKTIDVNGVLSLGNIKTLSHVTFDNMKKTVLHDDCLAEIVAKWPRLESLRIRECPMVSGKGIGKLAKSLKDRNNQESKLSVVSLESLSAGKRKKQEKGVIDTHVLNESLTSLAEIASLEHLSITNCATVSDGGLSNLGGGAKSIKSIELRDCLALSDTGIIALAHALPALKCLAIRDMSEVLRKIRAHQIMSLQNRNFK